MNIEDVKSDEKDVEDPLKKLFEKQKELVKKYKEIEKTPDYPLELDYYKNQQVIKDFKQRGMEEIAEAIEAFRRDEMEHFKEEMIDALHFFIELNILTGKEYDFFKALKEYNPVEKKLNSQTLYYTFGVVAEKYGLVCNTLKNKPWKQSQIKTDQVKFYATLKKAFDNFISMLFKCGFTSDDIYNYYFRKHKVNEFRIESKY